MDKRQYYLQKIAEEALEVATEAMKCIQFGSASYHPNDPLRVTNMEKLQAELLDLEGAILAAYRKEYIPKLPRDTNRMVEKADKIDRYCKTCQEIGTVV